MNIQEFNEKHKIISQQYTPEDVIAVNYVLHGNFTNIEKNKNALLYAGLYLMFEVSEATVTDKSCEQYLLLSHEKGNALATYYLSYLYYESEKYLIAKQLLRLLLSDEKRDGVSGFIYDVMRLYNMTNIALERVKLGMRAKYVTDKKFGET